MFDAQVNRNRFFISSWLIRNRERFLQASPWLIDKLAGLVDEKGKHYRGLVRGARLQAMRKDIRSGIRGVEVGRTERKNRISVGFEWKVSVLNGTSNYPFERYQNEPQEI